MTEALKFVYVLPDEGRVMAWSQLGLPQVGDFVTIGQGPTAVDYKVTMVHRLYFDSTPLEAESKLPYATRAALEAIAFVNLDRAFDGPA